MHRRVSGVPGGIVAGEAAVGVRIGMVAVRTRRWRKGGNRIIFRQSLYRRFFLIMK